MDPFPTPNASLVCVTDSCLRYSDILHSFMSPTYEFLDPCTDWDKYVCEGFRARNPVGEGRDYYSAVTRIEDQTKLEIEDIVAAASYQDLPPPEVSQVDHEFLATLNQTHGHGSNAVEEADRANFALISDYYNSCMHEKDLDKLGDQPLLDLLEEVQKPFEDLDSMVLASSGDLFNSYKPAIDTSASVEVHDSFRIRDSTVNLVKLGIWPFATLQPAASLFDPNTMTVRITPHRMTGMPSKKDYGGWKNAELHREYAQVLTTFFEHAYGNRTSMVQSRFAIPEKVFHFEKEIHKFLPSLENLQDPTNYEKYPSLSNIFTVARLNETVLRLAGPGAAHIETYEISHPKFFTKLSTLIEKTSKETVRSYFLWLTFLQTIDLWDMPWVKPAREFTAKLNNAKSADRRDICINRVKKHFAPIIESFYIRGDKFSPEANATAHEIFDDLREQIKFLINKTKFIKRSRGKLLDRAEEMTATLAYSHRLPIQDPEALFKYFSGASVRDGTDEAQSLQDRRPSQAHSLEKPEKWSHIHDYFELQRWNMNRSWSLLGKSLSAAPSLVHAYDTKHLYDPSRNRVWSPLARMRPPAFDIKVPSYIRYGYYGTELARNMMSQMYQKGSAYQPDGSVKPYSWQLSEKWGLDAQQNCMRKMVQREIKHHPQAKWLKEHVDWDCVKEKLVVDMDAVEAAYLAYKVHAKDESNKPLPHMGSLTSDQLFFIFRSLPLCGDSTSQYLQTRDKLKSLPDSITNWAGLRSLPAWRDAFNCSTRKYKCHGFGPN